MSDRRRPTLLLSAFVADRYREELHAIVPEARYVTHTPDGIWQGDPDAATVAYQSSDMWRYRFGREVLMRLGSCRSLEWVHTSSAGVDSPVFAALLSRGITVTNASGVNSVVIAQHVLAGMLKRARRLDEYRVQQERRAWEWQQCEELTGATVLIVGLGGIGWHVARLCHAFGMRVLGTRRRAEAVPDVDEVLPADAVESALPRADYVVLACPLTDATRHLINAGTLAAMKPTAYLINVARGGCVDQEALADALRAGSIAGALLDVFEREPVPAESPLWSTPNLTITPHTAASSPLNPERNARFFLANLARYVRDEPLENLVTEVE